MTPLEYALAYAAAGWQVFPVDVATKKPLVKWKDGATCDQSVIEDWWSSWPSAGIGLATGQRSGGVVVLDVDVKDGKDGEASLQELLARNEIAGIETLESRTTSGGSHLFFLAPKDVVIGNSRSKLGNGLDVRGDGGYVVLPDGAGKYEWLNEFEPTPLPEWLAKLMLAHSDLPALRASGVDGEEDRPPGNEAVLARARLVLSICEPSVEGQRGHDRAVVAARRAYDCGLNVEQTFEALRDCWNDRCSPPWSETELAHKCRQAPGFSAEWKARKEEEDAEFKAALGANVALQATVAHSVQQEDLRQHDENIARDSGLVQREKAPQSTSELVTLDRLRERIKSLTGRKNEHDRVVLKAIVNAEDGLDERLDELASTLARQFTRSAASELASLCAPALRCTTSYDERVTQLAARIAGAQSLEQAKQQAEAKKFGDWHALLKIDKEGKPKASVGNALTILRFSVADPESGGACLAYDAFVERDCWIAPPPWGGVDLASVESPAEIKDAHVTRLREWFEREHDTCFQKSDVYEALSVVAGENAFDPLKDLLTQLGREWDSTPRLDTWLADYCGAENSEIVRLFGAKWLISAVARAFVPGCQVDTCLVLMSDQGDRKTSLFRCLGFEERGWFHTLSGNSDLADPRTLSKLSGKWIVELGELTVLRRNSIEQVKQFMSEKTDFYRSPYARLNATHERRCVFVGTTNEGRPLQDHTGNRRFWPVSTKMIDLDGVRADRAQLWGEAVARFQGGEAWWLSSAQQRLAGEAQESAREADPWEDVLVSLLTTKERVTIPQIFGMWNVGAADVKATDANRLARCLRAIGWEAVRSKTQRCWQRGTHAEPMTRMTPR